jgi:hypothetical protein
VNSADLSQVIAAAGDAMAAEGVSRQVRERVANRLVWGHPDGDRTCPVHGTGMVYDPAREAWGCASPSCRYGQGAQAAGETVIGRMLAAVFGDGDGPPWTHVLQLPDSEEALAAVPGPAYTVTTAGARPAGELALSAAPLDDRLLILRADPEILVGTHLAAALAWGCRPGVLFDPLLRVLTVRGVNRTVTYRLGDLEPDGLAYRARLCPGPAL